MYNSSADRQLGKVPQCITGSKEGNWEDNDKRTDHYTSFTLKIDNTKVGRSTTTTLMDTSALNDSCPTSKDSQHSELCFL